MSAEPVERTVMPPAESLDNLIELFSHTGRRGRAALVGSSGEHIPVPAELFDVLQMVVAAMANGQAVTVAPHHQTLTTQEAADLLGVSRPTLVKLLETGEIPYEQPGRHRRVLLRDVLTYQEQDRKSVV